MKKILTRGLVLATAIGLLSVSGISWAQETNSERDMKNQIQFLKKRVNQLEQQLSKEPERSPASSQDEALWDPYTEMRQMQNEINRMFNNNFWQGMSTAGPVNWQQTVAMDPQVDIKQLSNEYVLKMDLPGMEKSNINIETEGQTLVISGEKKSDSKEVSPDKFTRRERSFGYFSRTVPLPDDVKAEKIQAEYKNGVLTINIPRVPKTEQPVKKSSIEIK